MQVMRLSATAADGAARVCFPADEPAFAGHFPEAPVLPGVVLIDAAIAIVGQALGRPLRLGHLATVKFVRTVAPGDVLDLDFKLLPDAARPRSIRATARWSRGAERIAEMTWTAEPDAVEGSPLP